MRPLVVKLLFRLRHPLLLQPSIELAASLNVRPLFASNELLSVLASLCQTPDAVFAHRRFGKRRGERPHAMLESKRNWNFSSLQESVREFDRSALQRR